MMKAADTVASVRANQIVLKVLIQCTMALLHHCTPNCQRTLQCMIRLMNISLRDALHSAHHFVWGAIWMPSDMPLRLYYHTFGFCRHRRGRS